jgi:hypothetical protein
MPKFATILLISSCLYTGLVKGQFTRIYLNSFEGYNSFWQLEGVDRKREKISFISGSGIYAYTDSTMLFRFDTVPPYRKRLKKGLDSATYLLTLGRIQTIYADELKGDQIRIEVDSTSFNFRGDTLRNINMQPSSSNRGSILNLSVSESKINSIHFERIKFRSATSQQEKGKSFSNSIIDSLFFRIAVLAKVFSFLG